MFLHLVAPTSSDRSRAAGGNKPPLCSCSNRRPVRLTRSQASDKKLQIIFTPEWKCPTFGTLGRQPLARRPLGGHNHAAEWMTSAPEGLPGDNTKCIITALRPPRHRPHRSDSQRTSWLAPRRISISQVGASRRHARCVPCRVRPARLLMKCQNEQIINFLLNGLSLCYTTEPCFFFFFFLMDSFGF